MFNTLKRQRIVDIQPHKSDLPRHHFTGEQTKQWLKNRPSVLVNNGQSIEKLIIF